MGSFDPLHLIGAIVAVVIVALTVWALVVTLRATDLVASEKVIWSLILVLFPGIGLIVWALLRLTRRRPTPTDHR